MKLNLYAEAGVRLIDPLASAPALDRLRGTLFGVGNCLPLRKFLWSLFAVA